MNKINKTLCVPSSLLTMGKKKTEEICRLVDAGELNLSFKKEVYAAEDVKKQLKEDQHKKCAYCERFLNGDYGSVEHFRPKGGYVGGKNKVLHKPGYYWLTYCWENLLFSCSECNTSYKRNLFPLVDETKRNISARDITQETPILINPATEDVGCYFEFARYYLVAKKRDDDIRSKGTITLLKLNERSDLVQRRRQCWEKYEEICNIREIANADKEMEIVAICDSEIEKITGEDAEFTGMFKYQFRKI